MRPASRLVRPVCSQPGDVAEPPLQLALPAVVRVAVGGVVRELLGRGAEQVQDGGEQDARLGRAA